MQSPQDDLLTALQIYLVLALALGSVLFWSLGKFFAWRSKRTAIAKMQSSISGQEGEIAVQEFEMQRMKVQSVKPMQTAPQPYTTYTGNFDWWHKLIKCTNGEGYHLLVAGGTGSGKSTITNALVKERSRKGKFFIIDSDAAPEDWGADVPLVGQGGNWQAIDNALQMVIAELDRRYQDRMQGITNPEPLTVIVEEFNTVSMYCKNAAQFIQALSSRGRKVNLLIILCGQSDLVASLRLQGKGDLRGNFARLRLGNKALEHFDYPQSVRAACCEIEGRNERVDVGFIPRYAIAKINLANYFFSTAQTAKQNAPQGLLISESETQSNAFSQDHLQVANIIAQEPTISGRELARRLYPNTDGSGDYYNRAKRLREEVEQVLSVKSV